MKRALLLLTFLVSFTTIAQQGINYKAVVKDGSGNIIVNDLIQVQFSILQGVAETNVYTENHTPTTDANGLIILNIGEGTTVSGDYTTIDWANDSYALNVQINTGGGLVDLGTTTFQAVPYAKHAITATFAETSGDTKWIEGTTANDITNTNTGTLEIKGALQIGTTNIIDEISNDETFADESDSTIPTQQAVKTYVDTKGPIAYGFVQSNSNITSGSGNFSANWDSTNSRYEITINGENYIWTLYTTNITSASSSIHRIRVSSIGEKMLVYFYNATGTLIQGNFQFTTFK